NAVKQQQGLIVEQQTKNTQQDTQISDVNLKTSQNVETVGQLQKSVDENLTVISSNFSAVDTKLALHDSAIGEQRTVNNEQQAEISNLNYQYADLSSQVANLDTQYSILYTQYSLSDAEKADLEARLTVAEEKFKAQENNLADMENKFLKELNTAYELLNGNDKLLNNRIDDLEAKIATLTITAGGEIPANVITMDASGNAILKGIFEAKAVVAGAYTVKNEKGTDAPTMGDATINPVPVDADGDGIDDVTGKAAVPSDGKTVKVLTKAATSSAKIMVTPVGSVPVNWIISSVDDGKSFTITLDKETAGSVKFSWWIVEEK
ncbi:MAG: hypothetical protein NT170_02295, partial [Candidatus Moranbacteria bacterium]|nr:hypothetical protein [Candidatus Moranbacteria bacterium]